MKNEDFMKRLKAMAEIAAKITKEQEAQKDREAAEAEDNDMVLAADLLMEASELLEEAASLVYEASDLLKGEDKTDWENISAASGTASRHPPAAG